MPISACGLRLWQWSCENRSWQRWLVTWSRSLHSSWLSLWEDGRHQRYSWSFLPFGFRNDDTPPWGQWSSLAGPVNGSCSVHQRAVWSVWSGQTMTANAPTAAHYTESSLIPWHAVPWHAGKSMAWDIIVVNTLAESYLSISASPGGAACRGEDINKILVSAIFQHLPTSGLETLSWSYKYHWYFIPSRVVPQIDECFKRPTWNDASFPARLSGGPALSWGCFQGDLFGPHRIGLLLLQLTLFLILDCNSRNLYYRG